jgi:hypothetical protein
MALCHSGHRGLRTFPARLVFRIVLAAGLFGGCSDSGATRVSPPGDHACAGGDAITLAVLASVTLDCSAGTSLQLPGNGATYLVVPQFAVGNVPNASTRYTLAATGTAADVAQRFASPDAAASGSASMPTTHTLGNQLQRSFDARLRSIERRAVAAHRWSFDAIKRTGTNSHGESAALSGGVPVAGSLRNFRVISSFDATTTTYVTVSAQLLFVGSNILIYVDTLAPANGFTSEQLNSFGQLFDQTFYTLDVNTFGSPSDIDGNGRLIVLLSPRVNALTPAAQCSTEGYIAGFFDGFDLSSTSSDSNQGEIFYSLVPDPAGTVSCAHSVASVASITPGTFLHEFQHLISFSQHVVVNHGSSEEGWLDEGMSIVAEELGSVYYEQKFPPPTGRSNPAQLFPDSSEGFISNLLNTSYAYLLETDTTTLTLHSDADGGLNWRGGDWLLLRWLGDQKGATFYKSLDQSTLTGTANIAAQAGESFQSLFGDFSLSLYADSIIGVPKNSIPPRNRFVTRTLRTLYQALFTAEGPSSSVPRASPIVPVALTGSITSTMVPGTMSFYVVTTAPGTGTSTIQFSSPGGAQLPASLHPQVSVFRLN